MKVMVIVKADADTEAGVLPTSRQLEEMGAYNQLLIDAGIMASGEGLKPSSQGKRVVFSGADRTVVDGPFARPEELIAGFWIWTVKDLDEAVAWARRCPNPTGEQSVLELRPFYEMADFGEAFTPDLRTLEAEQRATLEARSAG